MGRKTLDWVLYAGRLTLFAIGALRHMPFSRSWLRNLTRAGYDIGVRCLPVILIVGLFSGMVLALQGYYTLVRVGSEGVLGSAVALSLIRELGPVITALMAVAQAGSAAASEIGIQRNNEQIDALRNMGVHAPGFLAGPRLAAGAICFPLLTAFFDLVGLAGGHLTGVVLLGVDPGTFWNGVFDAVTYEDVSGGFLKAGVFGIVAMTICTYQGYFTHLSRGPRGVRAVTASTTRAVVHSSVAILVANYLVTSFLV